MVKKLIEQLPTISNSMKQPWKIIPRLTNIWDPQKKRKKVARDLDRIEN